MPTLRSVYTPLYFILNSTADTCRDLKPYLELEDLAKIENPKRSAKEQERIKNAQKVLDEVARVLTDTIRISRELITLYRNTFETRFNFQATALKYEDSIFKQARFIMDDLLEIGHKDKRNFFFELAQPSEEISSLFQAYLKKKLSDRAVIMIDQGVGTE